MPAAEGGQITREIAVFLCRPWTRHAVRAGVAQNLVRPARGRGHAPVPLLCSAGEFEYGSPMAAPRRRTLILVAGITYLSAGFAAAALGADGTAAITCRNPVSGASWQITIDYGKATVDSHPAKIS